MSTASPDDPESQLKLALLNQAQQWWYKQLGALTLDYELDAGSGVTRQWTISPNTPDFKDGLPVTILRPTAIYGPRDVEILEAFRSVKRRVLPITGEGSVKYTFIYGPDCAEACIKAISADVPSGSTYFVADGDVWTQKDMMQTMEQAFGTRALFRQGIPFGVVKAAAFFVEAYGKAANKPVMLTREKAAMLEKHFVCDPAETKKALGWEPEVRFEEGSKLTARWYEAEGWL